MGVRGGGGGVLRATLQVKRGAQGCVYIEFRSKGGGGGGVRTPCIQPCMYSIEFNSCLSHSSTLSYG